MRAIVLALLIIMLPVRGWVSDAMATSIDLQQAMAQAVQIAVPADASGLNNPATDDTQAECGACATCQMCHVVALVTSAPLIQAAPLAHAMPASPHLSFISAERASGYKPPIF